jgi:hypothetical protein
MQWPQSAALSMCCRRSLNTFQPGTVAHNVARNERVIAWTKALAAEKVTAVVQGDKFRYTGRDPVRVSASDHPAVHHLVSSNQESETRIQCIPPLDCAPSTESLRQAKTERHHAINTHARLMLHLYNPSPTLSLLRNRRRWRLLLLPRSPLLPRAPGTVLLSSRGRCTSLVLLRHGVVDRLRPERERTCGLDQGCCGRLVGAGDVEHVLRGKGISGVLGEA